MEDKRSEEWEQQWDIEDTVQYIGGRGLQHVALQFPDELLKDSVLVARSLQQACKTAGMTAQIYLLADTSYNSLGVDEVAAQHANADAVVHYGRASLSPLSRLPAFFVFGHAPLDVDIIAKEIAGYAAAPVNPEGKRVLLVLLDQPLVWAVPALKAAIEDRPNPQDGIGLSIVVADIAARHLEPKQSFGDLHPQCSCSGNAIPDQTAKAGAVPSSKRPEEEYHTRSEPEPDTESSARSADTFHRNDRANGACGEPSTSGRSSLGGLIWTLPAGVSDEEVIWLWVGPDDSPALLQLQMTYNACDWAMLEPDEVRWQEGIPLDISKRLRRRYYLVEKAKNANIVGIVVGTLGVAGYLDAVDHVRKLAQAAGKKTYTLLMGKPSPAKLANFPEVEVFVLVADPQGQILDSKEFYAPIITPYEAQLAFSPGAEWSGAYRLDFDSLLLSQHDAPASAAAEAEPRFSLLDGSYHDGSQAVVRDGGGGASDVEGSKALAECGRRDVKPGLGNKGQLAEVRSAAEFLKLRRSYQGLESPMTGAEPKQAEVAVQGRAGRAAQYAGEPSTDA